MPDALARLLRVLSEAPLPPGTDARAVADALWLAASGTVGASAPPAPPPSAEGPWDTGAEPEPAEGSAEEFPPGGTDARTAGPGVELSVRRAGTGTAVRGVAVSLGRGSALPDALAVGRAVQPFHRPWRRGARERLDIEATVEHYARGGPLVPLFGPAPEPWFEVVVLVDSSLSMSVWEETTRAVTRLLTRLGGFRAVHTWRLSWAADRPRVQDHQGREVPGARVPHYGSGAGTRRLILVVSDCAARGWHEPEPWLLLRDWGRRGPVALLDPLPSRLWRRSALDHPAVRVTSARTGGPNSTLRFALPPRLKARAEREEGLAPWVPLPVVACTARSLGAWAGTLMRGDPAGCDAVLLPESGRLRTNTPARRSDPGRLAEAFVHTAPAPAVRLAVLCSGLPELPLALLHVLREEAVPEAEHADVAELLTSGLFTVRREPEGDPVLVLHAAARAYLRDHLTTHDVWQTRAALGRHAAAHPHAPRGIAAVLHDAWAPSEVPADPVPFGRTAAVSGWEASGPDGGEARRLADWAWTRIRTDLSPGMDRQVLADFGKLLRHLIDYAHSRLPAPLGSWPGPDTPFDDRRVAQGVVTASDVLEDLCGFASAAGVGLTRIDLAREDTEYDLLWAAPSGAVPVQLTMHRRFSWHPLLTSSRYDQGRVPFVPLALHVHFDEADTPDGLATLDDCLKMVRYGGSQPGLAVLLRVQTRYGPAPGGSGAALADALRALRAQAGHPAYVTLAHQAALEQPPVRVSSDQLSAWFSGRAVPSDERAYTWLTDHLARLADPADRGEPGPVPARRHRFAALRHHALAESRRAAVVQRAARQPAQPLADFLQGYAKLERASYTAQPHDAQLRDAVGRVVGGESAAVMLVGPPGSGKTRSALAALRTLPEDWQVWEPRNTAALRTAMLTRIPLAPRTAIWLDHGESYLFDRKGRGEGIAGGLDLWLRTAVDGPALLLIGLRPDSWTTIATPPPEGATDAHAQVRSLLFRTQVVFIDRPTQNLGGPVAPGRLVDGTAAEALRTLLGRADLPPAEVRAAVDQAIAWLRREETLTDREFVLGALLGHNGMTSKQATQVARLALTWLEEHDGSQRAEYVLGPLLALEELPEEDAERAVRMASEWLDAFGAERTAHFVLRPVLRRRDLPKERADTVVDHALNWLEGHRTGQPAQFVLGPVLRRRDLPSEALSRCARVALDWLHDAGTDREAMFVLRPLLQRNDLDPTVARSVEQLTLEWLQVHDAVYDTRFVLRPLLRRTGLSPEVARPAVGFTLSWLQEHGTARQAHLVLHALLSLPELDAHETDGACRAALEWLESHPHSASAHSVLRPLLRRGIPDNELSVRAVEAGEEWCRARAAEGKPDNGIARLVNASRGVLEARRNRLVLVFQIVGMARASRADQSAWRTALDWVLSVVLDRDAGFRREGQHTGDGWSVVLLPDGKPRSERVSELLRRLEDALHEHSVVGSMRLCFALHHGEVVKVEHGWAGQALITASRLVDSAPVRAAMDHGRRSSVAAVLSDVVFTELAAGPGSALTTRFRPVYIGSQKAWLSVAGYEEPPGIEPWSKPPAPR
ncbi:SAV_2336 N-terminal domain-related protein [Streptomyces sp. NPDC047014]|uniref:SAV_2336 N-terminal domain-related protein n=1 Tax=Streptomyces sp. NPDC047014 TaxID=3155736 RepID=UPI0033D215C9